MRRDLGLTILSDNEIVAAMKAELLHIIPFSNKNLAPSGYDFSSAISIDLDPKGHKLISTYESIELSNQILATIHLKSSLSREGLVGSFAIIDPGYRGQLTLSLFNASTTLVSIKEREPIVQIVFHKTGEPSSKPYSGKYQDSQGIVSSKRK